MITSSDLKACIAFPYDCLRILVGLLACVFWITIVILSTPVYAYRFVLSWFANRYYNGTLGKIVDAASTLFAVEFLPSFQHLPPKCVIVITIVTDGKVSLQETRKTLMESWVAYSGYPQLQQYVEPWNGFLFWKKDVNFRIENHVNSHQIEGECSSKVEHNVRRFVEELLNKRFMPQRSPWEWFVLNNYRNESLKKESEHDEVTLHIVRLHHVLGDGYSIARAMIERIIGTPLEAALFQTPGNSCALSKTEKILAALSFPYQLLVDMRHIFELAHAAQFYSRKTPLHAPADGGLLYEKHEVRIAIKRIKEIKNKLGVSFTGVLLAAYSAGIAKLLHKKNRKESQLVKNVKLFVVLPLPGHSTGLQNHLTATYIELPTTLNLHPNERLGQVERELKHARKNTLPLLYPLFVQSMGSLFPAMASFFLKIRFAPLGLTNFPGPPGKFRFHGKKCLMGDFIAGTLVGATGVLISLFSFGEYIQISASCGKTVMDVSDAQELMNDMVDEMNILYDL